MPPRYAYWTILVDDQPTAFRAGAQEDLMPTFKRLQSKHPSAKMMWFQNGKLWDSRIDAQEAMRARGDIGRARDPRQAGFRSRDRAPFKPQAPTFAKAPAGKPSHRPTERRSSRPPVGERPEWKPKSSSPQAPKPTGSEKPEWAPKSQAPSPHRRQGFGGQAKPQWRPKGSAPDRRPAARPDWKPRGDEGGKPAWKPKGAPSTREPFRGPKPFARSGQGKLEWRPKSSASAKASADKQAPSPEPREKRKWVPKAEYKKAQGIEAKKDKNWRPGGEHQDPRQKYKDAKKAKWTRFKKAIRTRSDKKKS